MNERPLHPTLNAFEQWASKILVPPIVNFDKDFSGRYCDSYTFHVYFIWSNGFQNGYSAARNPSFAKAAAYANAVSPANPPAANNPAR